MDTDIRYGEERDFDWLCEQDDIEPEQVRACLAQKKYVVAAMNEELVGFMRCNLYWHKIPFMEMIRVAENHRRKGIGTKLVEFWEQEMQGAKVLMTSALSNEPEPQEWHKRNGFFETGETSFGVFQSTPEKFFVKNLVTGG